MKKKKILAAALAAAMVLAMPLTVSANWQKDDNGVWSWSENGTKATGWKQVDGTWYYFDASGNMKTGWQKVDGTWYFMKDSGAMATGWVKNNGTWYFMKGSGAMATGWVKTGDKWYYMESSGAMATGKVEVSGKTYILGDADDGAMKSGKVEYEGKTYILGDKDDGAVKTGFVTDGEDTYFSTTDGVQTGVVEVDGDIYYFDEEKGGAMATGTVTIDNKVYKFDEDGACTSYRKPDADVAFSTDTTTGEPTPAEPGSTGDSTGGGSGGSDDGTGGSTGGGSTGGSSSSVNNNFTITYSTPTHDGGTDDALPGTHGNVDKYKVSGSGTNATVTVKAPLERHGKGGSSAPEEQGKWVGVKITTDVPVTELFYKNETANKNGGSLARLAASEAVDGDDYSFVYWFAVDRVGTGGVTFMEPQVIRLSATGHNDALITINVEGLKSDLAVESTVSDTAKGEINGAFTGGTQPASYPATAAVEGTTIKLTGTVPYTTGWTGFSSVASLQEGNFVAVVLKKPAGFAGTATLKGSVDGDKPITFGDLDDTAEILVWNVKDKTKTATIEIDKDGAGNGEYAKTVYTIDFSALTLTPKETVTPPPSSDPKESALEIVALGNDTEAYNAVKAAYTQHGAVPSQDYFKKANVSLSNTTFTITGEFTPVEFGAYGATSQYAGLVIKKPANVTSDQTATLTMTRADNGEQVTSTLKFTPSAIRFAPISGTQGNWTITVDWDGAGNEYKSTTYTVNFRGCTVAAAE